MYDTRLSVQHVAVTAWIGSYSILTQTLSGLPGTRIYTEILWNLTSTLTLPASLTLPSTQTLPVRQNISTLKGCQIGMGMYVWKTYPVKLELHVKQLFFLVYVTHLLFRKKYCLPESEVSSIFPSNSIPQASAFSISSRVLCITSWFPHYVPTVPLEAIPDLPMYLCYIRTLLFPGALHVEITSCTGSLVFAAPSACKLPETGASHGLCTAHPQPWEQGRDMEVLSHDALSTERINQSIAWVLRIFMVIILFSVYVAPVHFHHFVRIFQPYRGRQGRPDLDLSEEKITENWRDDLDHRGRMWVRWQSGHLSFITLSCCPDHSREE